MKEVLLELLRVQYAPNAPKGHKSILYMIIDKGHKDKGVYHPKTYNSSEHLNMIRVKLTLHGV